MQTQGAAPNCIARPPAEQVLHEMRQPRKDEKIVLTMGQDYADSCQTRDGIALNYLDEVLHNFLNQKGHFELGETIIVEIFERISNSGQTLLFKLEQ